ncbi:hypothetical protein CERSUDRAFT_117254 [Gelatoporia subvermispora B]|uniref:Amidohydrolase-related domain-containing protein n=1 Tax=Ceriporiopsis subvermispora (strain B) TaxID=914234 RepID=M2QQE1_CERS8|nr:hypothetical protein CERSUDRAFT_117254 [Gelatoporia subvermispora B]
MGHLKSGFLDIQVQGRSAQRSKATLSSHLFKGIILLSLAGVLSTVVPSPASLFRARQASVKSVALHESLVDPASQWKDDIWPIREQTPWDISTDYPFPRSLEYDVTEGTWLRLDVHPTSGDIVFDMVGDIYCLPGEAYAHGQLASAAVTKARPVLLGIPHDSDPHFSPEGDKIVFRSDAGLGVENIWVADWKGCSNMDIRPSGPAGELLGALQTQHTDEALLASGVKETAERKQRRLLREGRLGARRVTNETYRWISDARFHPSGDKVIATKWYTSGRSLGAGEGWLYTVPNVSDPVTPIKVGSGERLVGRTLPLGWGPELYGDQQIGPEQLIWAGNDTLIWSKNVKDTDGTFQYSKDVHQGIYAIFSTNLTTKRTTTVVGANPGGATRPELSRDGRTLAFVRRVRDKEALVLKDLKTGTLHHIWHGLTYDLGAVSAPMGTYPSFAFTPSDDAVIIWAAGQIYHVPLSVNAHGEKVTGGTPHPIRFTAHIEKRIAETVTASPDLLKLETADTQRVYAFNELRVNEDGSLAVFQASGATYVQDVVEGKSKTKPHARPVPVLHPGAPYYSPTFIVGAPDLVLHARWSDVNFTSFELANLTSGIAYQVHGLPLGRYYSPILCECAGARRQIAFVKTGGDYLSGDIVATAGAGLYLGEITLPSSKHSKVTVSNLRHVPFGVGYYELQKTKIQFLDKNKKLLVQSPQRAFIVDLAAGPDENGDYAEETLATGLMSTELVVPQQGKSAAFVDFFQVYYAPSVNASEPLWSKPATTTKGLVRVSVDGGHDITFSRDGEKLFWFLGPFLHHVDVSEVSACAAKKGSGAAVLDASCAKTVPSYQEVIVEYVSDVGRLRESSPFSGFLLIANARLLTMETGDLAQDLRENAMLFVRDGEIMAIVNMEDAVVPENAMLLDAEGGLVVPGFIDVHAHWNGFATLHPARSWEMETFLAYGITTLHNPSSDNVLGFTERFRLERGQLVGPRIYHTGDVIYGAGAAGIHQDIVDMDEAYSALIRIKAEGGPTSFSYKNYNQPSRASRQRLLLAARKLGMLCVPEGGMNYDWDQTYIVDGMTTIEHALPIPVLHDDIITLYALSGTGSTPTHIVNYGGVMAEQLVWARSDVPDEPKLRRFTRHDILEGLSESTARPNSSYAFYNTTISTAKMVRKGLRTHIGAHGEAPLGYNYHAELWFTRQGGLTNYEVLRAATVDAAITLGIDSAVGSLTPGKLADFVVYPPGVDLLDGQIVGSRKIKYVGKGGRLWDAETLTEVFPQRGRRPATPPINPE